MRWLLAQPHAGRGASGNHIAGMQRHELRQIADQMRDAVDHRLGRAVLIGLAIHRQPHGHILRIGHLIARYQPGADLAKVVAGFALGPLARPFDLKGAF